MSTNKREPIYFASVPDPGDMIGDLPACVVRSTVQNRLTSSVEYELDYHSILRYILSLEDCETPL